MAILVREIKQKYTYLLKKKSKRTKLILLPKREMDLKIFVYCVNNIDIQAI